MAFRLLSRRKEPDWDPGTSWILAFSGPIQSGKSTVSEELGRILRVPVASFGGYVRDQAKARFTESTSAGPVEDRRRLQELGQELLDTHGAEKFCRSVLIAAGWTEGQSLVVDGVRHTAILKALRRLGYCYLVYLDVDPTRRRAGLLASGYTDEDIEAMIAHPTELELRDLKKKADLILEDKPIDELIEAVLSAERLGFGKGRGAPPGPTEGLDYEADEARLGFRALHVSELVSMTGTNASRVTRYREEGRIFAYENGDLSFPEWQFDEVGEPFPIVGEVLQYLRPHLTESEVAKWFVEEQQYLDGLLPYELIEKDPFRLLAAARTAAHLIGHDFVPVWKEPGENGEGGGGAKEIQRWHSEIIEVDGEGETFVARMLSSTGSFVPRDASFSIDQVHPRDCHRVVQGATFTWIVMERDTPEARQRCSTIVFPPPRVLTSNEIEEAREAGDELIRILGHD